MQVKSKQWGGARKNAGRKKGHGKYGQDILTHPIRAPKDLIQLCRQWFYYYGQTKDILTSYVMLGELINKKETK